MNGILLPSCYADQWNRTLLRLELDGNDGADIYEAQEFCAWIEQRYGEKIETLISRLETYIMRKMGPAFDPERVCQYTGLALWQHAACDREGNFGTGEPGVFYWREDGECCRFRLMNETEKAWVAANPEPHLAACRQFWAWKESLQTS